jgi:hypothetical protein
MLRLLRPLAVLLVTSCLATAAQAQFSTQKFIASPFPTDYLTIGSSEVNGHLRPAFALMID